MEAVGLVLGVLGISGLFTACIQNFDIVVNSRNFGQEFDLLCTQRIRLVLWGETLGLVPGPTGSRIPYNNAIDRSDIRPAIESTLNHLRLLLQNAEVVTGRYELEECAADVKDLRVISSTGFTIFRERFESFKTRIRKNQKTSSTWTVTRWAVHDSAKFRAMVGNIKELMDGLEGITSTLGVLDRQQALLTEEVDSISDTRSLRLLQEVASLDGTSPSLRIVSDAASIRLSITEGSISSQANRSRMTGSIISYHTAPSHAPEQSMLSALGEVSSGDESSDDSHARPSLALLNSRRPLYSQTEVEESSSSLALIDVTKLKEVVGENSKPEQRPSAPSVADIPQNQRLIASLMSKASAQTHEQKFDSGSLHYGEVLSVVKRHDEDTWKQKSTSILLSADKGESAARRIFLELRSIRNAGVPFISAAPIGDSLDKILASIEGPPDTPYEGGIFWISIKFPESLPAEPPLLRFQTKVYHPNIDPNGNICADYQRWWNDPNLQRYMFSMTSRAKGSWFSGSSSNRYSLGALLTALCGLLACPNVEDPFVPEIASTYITDYESYCNTARLYTKRYATAKSPSIESMDFDAPVSWAIIPTRRAGLSNPSSFYGVSVSRLTLPNNENTSISDTASTKSKSQASRPIFMPTGEGRELSDEMGKEDGFEYQWTRLPDIPID
ncbi:hypothetical protein G7Z17_g2699 [Cylindrodendrum hubeiense]|uniref:UBC core domain-containing protein n=1 Tax=Cylindrodendrum hubeiense TaxID=595255 RepID=A0A9P5HMJ9_9HYPO|nr:hypothetical protein G7Z17_g2699 [Cylindrodendrum hubeiense]